MTTSPIAGTLIEDGNRPNAPSVLLLRVAGCRPSVFGEVEHGEQSRVEIEEIEVCRVRCARGGAV